MKKFKKKETNQTAISDFFRKKDIEGHQDSLTRSSAWKNHSKRKETGSLGTTSRSVKTPVKMKSKRKTSGRKKMAAATPMKDSLKQRRMDDFTPIKTITPTKLQHVLTGDLATGCHDNGNLATNGNLAMGCHDDGNLATSCHDDEPSIVDGHAKRVLFTGEKNAVAKIEVEKEEEAFSDDQMDCDINELLMDLPSDDWDSHDESHDCHMINGIPRQYHVEKVEHQPYCDENNLTNAYQIIVNLTSHSPPGQKSSATCYLRDDWTQTDVRCGDVVHFFTICSSSSMCPCDHHMSCQPDTFIVSNDSCYRIIINPDYLISGTTIANGINCTRRGVLGELLQSSYNSNEAMLVGKLLHELFQKALVACSKGQRVTDKLIKSFIPNLICNTDTLEQLYYLDLNELKLKEQLIDSVPMIAKWCNEWYYGNGKVEWKRSSSVELVDVKVVGVTDIEENIWSPRLGLKGKIDATFNVKVGTAGNEVHLMPFEIKTGKMYGSRGSVEHRAQVALYCMMLSDIHSEHVPAGLLQYLKYDQTCSVFAPDNETRALLIARNHLARYHGNHWDHVTLPDMLREPRTCRYCPYLTHCALHHKVFEGGGAITSGLGEHYPSFIDHMTPSWVKFYRHWYRLIIEETSYGQQEELKEKIWRKSTRERVEGGSCISDLLPCQPAEGGGDRFGFAQRFIVEGDKMMPKINSINVNDNVIVSRVDGRGWAVARGYVTRLDKKSLTLALDKAVSCDDGNNLYCIDISSYSQKGLALETLAAVCSSDGEREQQLRELVIDRRRPQCHPLTHNVFTNNEELMLQSLNDDQKNAVRNVILSKDYSLVLGLPGTGKTTTIATLIQVLVARGHSILLTSLTNVAVDNVLMKLIHLGVDFLRIGSSGIAPAVSDYSLHNVMKSSSNVNDIKELISNKLLMATTCHGVGNPLFAHRYFDYCIMDEAGQIPLPLSLAPLRLAKCFVLVGDHHQLPPLVRSSVARDGGYDQSLFKILCQSHPQVLTSLKHQHRMNKIIMGLSNKLIYNNLLECANRDIAMATMHVPDMKWREEVGQDWLKRTINPLNPVVFLNTDKCGRELEENVSSNTFEGNKIVEIVGTLLQYGVKCDDILVLTQYKSQQKLLKKLIHQDSCLGTHSDSIGMKENGYQSVEVLTVDKCQGRDSSCVIVSFVRSNTQGKVGQLLLKWERINVALTRAKHKLIFIGSCDTLSHAPCINDLIDHVKTSNLIIDLPQ